MTSTTNERSRLITVAADNDTTTDATKLSNKTRNIILFSIWIGVFLGALDTTIVASLVTSISSSFGQSNYSGWLATSYLLSTATFTPIYGRLCDILGRRGAALLALSLFTIGTILCGSSTTMNQLIIARLIAGSGGGGIMSVSSIIASDLVPLKQRGLVQGIANCFFGLGSGIGGPLGGILAASVGWRMAFLLQVPLLALSFGMIFTFVRYEVPGQGKSKREMLRRIDYGGSLSLMTALGSLLLALSYKNNDSLPWDSKFVYIPLILFAVFSLVFVIVEGYFAPEPVMPLRILGQRNGMCVAAVNFFLSGVSFSVLYFLPMWFEVVKMQTAATAGSHLLPNSVALSVGSLFAGYYMRRTGKYYKLTMICSLFPVIALVLLARMDASSSTLYQWFAVVPSGFGFSAIVTSILIALIASVDRADVAVATGITYLFRYVGQVVGVAFSSAILQSVLNYQLHQRIKGEGAEEIIEQIRKVTSCIPDLPLPLQRAAIDSYATGLRYVFMFNAGLATITFLCTLPIKSFLLPGSFAEEEVERERRSTLRDQETR